MEIHQIMTQYSKKLLNTLNSLEQLSSELLRSIVNRVTDLFKKIVKSMHFQAWTSLAFGVATGGMSMAAVAIPSTAHPLVKPIAESLSKALPQFGQTATTLIHANETRDNLNQSLMREHLMQQQKEIGTKITDAKTRQEDTISKLMDINDRGFHRA